MFGTFLTPQIMLIAVSVISFVTVIYLSYRLHHMDEEEEEQEERIEVLDKTIKNKEKKLHELKTQIDFLELKPTVNLTVAQNQVLNHYERQGIKIPVDIIEDLSTSTLTNQKDLIEFVEHQRQAWKLENSKKVFKKATR